MPDIGRHMPTLFHHSTARVYFTLAPTAAGWSKSWILLQSPFGTDDREVKTSVASFFERRACKKSQASTMDAAERDSRLRLATDSITCCPDRLCIKILVHALECGAIVMLEILQQDEFPQWP